VVHTVTYFVVGLLAFWVFDYSDRFAAPGLRHFLRQTDHPLVMAGVLFQPIRGLLFGLVFYVLRDVVLRPGGWWVMWLTLVVVGIVSPFGPAPGSIEGLVYTTLPVRALWGGMLEVVVQSLLLSVLVCHWVNRSESRWLGRLLIGLFIVTLALPVIGLLSRLD
jgi:hypothetical protein